MEQSSDTQRDLAVCGHALAAGEKTRRAADGAHDPTPTPVELDERLAAEAAAWSVRYEQVRVVCASALDLPLAPYTHVYLFNPFDTPVLRAFLDKLEREAAGPVTLTHMSDNGEWPAYLGRVGWSMLREGTFDLPGEQGDCPQHFSVRRFVP